MFNKNKKTVLTVLNLIHIIIIGFLILSITGYDFLLIIAFFSGIISFFIINKFSSLVEKDKQLDLEIYKREKIEKNFHKCQEIFKKAFEDAATGIVFASIEGKYIKVNRAFCDMLGYTEKEFYKFSYKDITPEQYFSIEKNYLKDILNGKKKTFNMEKKYIHKNGHEVWAILNISLLKNAKKEPLYFIAQVQNITNLKEIEEQLRFNNQFLFNVFNSSPILMSIEDLNTEKILDVNLSWTKHTGYEKEEVIGKYSNELKFIVNNDQELNKKVIGNTNYKHSTKVLYRKKNGEKKAGVLSTQKFEVNGKKYLLKMLKDITEINMVTNKMVRYERLNLIGEMAAGIGHEVRNPMTTVRGFLQLFRQKEEFIGHKETFNLMIDELDRANSIITEFLSIGKNKEVEVRLQNLNDVINKIKPLLQADAFENEKEAVFSLNDIPDIYLNEKQIRQVILNLFRNGLQAMKDKGKITVCTYKRKNEIVLTIKDEGPGISPEILDKIGTPFFTTKENGTGLGLAVCFGIAEVHNARIEMRNGKKGAIFNVVFNMD